MSRYQNLIERYFPFDSYRPEQFESIDWILSKFLKDKCHHVTLESPTGCGKSVIGYTVAKVIDHLKEDGEQSPKTLMVTKSKLLQTQYENTFEDINSVWGVSNYNCGYFQHSDTPDVKYGDYACKKARKIDINQCDVNCCEYLIARNKFKNSKVGVTNYHYLFSTGLESKLAVFDECHNIQTILTDFVGVSLSLDYLLKVIEILPKVYVELNFKVINGYKELIALDYLKPSWHHLFLKPAQKLILDIKELMQACHGNVEVLENYGKYEKHIKYFNNVMVKLGSMIFSILELKNWVMSVQTESSVELKPLDISKYIGHIFNRFDKILFMSGSVCGVETFYRTLGLDPSKGAYRSVESHFSPDNHKIYSLGLTGLNYTNIDEEFKNYIIAIDNILNQLKNRRGIIHCPSYKLAERILEESAFSKRLVIPKITSEFDLDEFMLDNDSNAVIVSPALFEGIDLRDDLSEFQIVAKIPYLSLGDNLVKQRLQQSREWYQREAVMKTIQACGRSVRSETDQCITFILDGQFDRLYKSNEDKFPNWFKDSLILGG